MNFKLQILNKIMTTDKKFEWFRGDKVLWAVILVFSCVSVFFVFSATSNLEYIVRSGTVFGHTLKHFFFIVIGLLLMRGVFFIKYEYIGLFSGIGLLGAIILLGIASASGQEIDGASAARWINIGGISFQPSTFAYLMLIIYLCYFLGKVIPDKHPTNTHLFLIFFPLVTVLGLVFKDNASTAIIIFLVTSMVFIIGQFPFKYIVSYWGIAISGAIIFLFLAFNFPNIIGANRVDTWKSRIESFINGDSNNYQKDRAIAAIVHGGTAGVGPGKSALKQSLPQSASDFIFAIIVEEYGLWGAFALLFLYFIIFVRIIIIARDIPSFLGKLIVLSIGVMLFIQISTNIAVAIGILPVTGQPLPLISYGGTSMLVTYIQLGIVLNISTRVQVRNEEGFGERQSIEEIHDIA